METELEVIENKKQFIPVLPTIRERIIIEVWVNTRKAEECVKALKDRIGVEVHVVTVRRWLKRPWVIEYIGNELKKKALAEGMDEVTWRALGSDQMLYDGNVLGYGKFDSLRTFYWKELGKALGYYKEGEGVKVMGELRLVQADGQK